MQLIQNGRFLQDATAMQQRVVLAGIRQSHSADSIQTQLASAPNSTEIIQVFSVLGTAYWELTLGAIAGAAPAMQVAAIEEQGNVAVSCCTTEIGLFRLGS